jgi:heptosyltransferase-2
MAAAVNNVLLVRTDRLGDVILSTPAATALRKNFPGCRVTFLARNETRPILECHPHVDEILIVDEPQFAGLRGFFRLVAVLKKKKYDTIVLLHPAFSLACLAFLSRIPQRIGTGYRFYSALFTHRVFEHRKTVQFHEAEYNLRLLQALGIENATVEFHHRLPESERRKSEKKLVDLRIRVDDRPVILHIGSGGSARDWPLANFATLADALSSHEQRQIVFTGSAGEIDLVARIIDQTRTKPLNLAGRLTLKDLMVLLERAAVFVGNSTGPLHLAVMVGAPVVAFYPPIRVCRPERWGPYGRRTDVLMSQQEECFRCRKTGEKYCACMAAITVQQAIEKIHEKIGARQPAPLHR